MSKHKKSFSAVIRENLSNLWAWVMSLLSGVKDFFYDISVALHKKRRKNKSMGHFKRSERIFLFTLLAYPVLHVTIFYVGVNFNSILLAFEKYDMNAGKYYFDGISNFMKFFNALKYESLMKTALKNSCLTYLFMQGVFFPLCVLFSFFIYKKLPGAGFFKIVLFLPQIMSSIVVTLMFKYFVEVGIPYLIKEVTHADSLPMSWLANVETRYWTLLFYGMWAGFGGSIILIRAPCAGFPIPSSNTGVWTDLRSGRSSGISRSRSSIRRLPLYWWSACRDSSLRNFPLIIFTAATRLPESIRWGIISSCRS